MAQRKVRKSLIVTLLSFSALICQDVSVSETPPIYALFAQFSTKNDGAIENATLLSAALTQNATESPVIDQRVSQFNDPFRFAETVISGEFDLVIGPPSLILALRVSRPEFEYDLIAQSLVPSGTGVWVVREDSSVQTWEGLRDRRLCVVSPWESEQGYSQLNALVDRRILSPDALGEVAVAGSLTDALNYLYGGWVAAAAVAAEDFRRFRVEQGGALAPDARFRALPGHTSGLGHAFAVPAARALSPEERSEAFRRLEPVAGVPLMPAEEGLYVTTARRVRLLLEAFPALRQEQAEP